MSGGLFRNTLFSFQVFEIFLFLFFIYCLTPLLSENIFYDFSSFRFVEACFEAQDTVYFGFLGAQKNAYFDLVGWNIL